MGVYVVDPLLLSVAAGT